MKTILQFAGLFRRAFILFFSFFLLVPFIAPNAEAADIPSGSFARDLGLDNSEIATRIRLALGISRNQLHTVRDKCDRHADHATAHETVHLLGLAECYKSGHGRPKSLLRAMELFKAASVLGSAEAHLALGSFYQDGRIVEKDLVRTSAYFRVAAHAGLPTAMVELGLVMLRMGADRRVACNWFSRAARHGARDGIRLLGDCFAQRVGGRRVGARATELYEKAARLGDRTAVLKLAGHEFTGVGADIAEQEGCHWASRAAARYNQPASRAHAYCLSHAK